MAIGDRSILGQDESSSATSSSCSTETSTTATTVASVVINRSGEGTPVADEECSPPPPPVAPCHQGRNPTARTSPSSKPPAPCRSPHTGRPPPPARRHSPPRIPPPPTGPPPRPPSPPKGPPPNWKPRKPSSVVSAAGHEVFPAGEVQPVLPDVAVFDSHCHLDRLFAVRDREHNVSREKGLWLERSEEEWKGLLQTFEEEHKDEMVGLEGLITVFCDPYDFVKKNRFRIRALLADKRVYCALGFHPLKTGKADNVSFRELESAIVELGDKVVALGECGLDFGPRRMKAPSETTQIGVFKRQIALAIKLDKPLVLHVRGADREAFRIMDESSLPRDWSIHMHCFTSPWESCQRWMSAWPGMKFGFTPNMMPRETVAKIPLDKLLLETDAPYFKPREVTSRPDSSYSHPGFVLHCAQQVAALRGCDVQEVAAASRRNVKAVYKI